MRLEGWKLIKKSKPLEFDRVYPTAEPAEVTLDPSAAMGRKQKVIVGEGGSDTRLAPNRFVEADRLVVCRGDTLESGLALAVTHWRVFVPRRRFFGRRRRGAVTPVEVHAR